MAKQGIGEIARGDYSKSINQQALKQMVGPVQNAQTDTSLTGTNAQTALAALQKAQGQSETPSPTVSTGGGAMAGNANGISAGGGNVMTKQQVPTSDALLGVRASFNNAGINNVGWNAETGSVTIDGKDALKPANVTDGTSYADRQLIQQAINSYYNGIGKPLAGADSYVGQALGVEGAVSWSDGNLMVGGQIVPTVYIDDNGTAYAHKADLDNAIEAYKKSSGITGNQEVYNNWQDSYGKDIKSALKAITNRKEWSYNPEDDAAYQAYKEQYIREGNRAYQDAYAQMAASTGGYGSSAAMSAAGQQMNYYMQQLNDRVPELMSNDYNRYLGEQQLRKQALDSIMGVADSDYGKQYQANRDAINDVNAANEQSYKRSIDARDYNRDVLTEDRLWDYNKDLYADAVKQSRMTTDRFGENADAELRAKQLSNEAAELANWQTKLSNFLSKYQYSANNNLPISAADAATLGIPAREDGSYPTISDIQTAYAQLQSIASNTEWNEYGRKQLYEQWLINNGLYGG